MEFTKLAFFSFLYLFFSFDKNITNSEYYYLCTKFVYVYRFTCMNLYFNKLYSTNIIIMILICFIYWQKLLSQKFYIIIILNLQVLKWIDVIYCVTVVLLITTPIETYFLLSHALHLITKNVASCKLHNKHIPILPIWIFQISQSKKHTNNTFFRISSFSKNLHQVDLVPIENILYMTWADEINNL